MSVDLETWVPLAVEGLGKIAVALGAPPAQIVAGVAGIQVLVAALLGSARGDVSAEEVRQAMDALRPALAESDAAADAALDERFDHEDLEPTKP